MDGSGRLRTSEYLLADNSIAQNIAFGVPQHAIDMTRVKQAAEQAQIASFIESAAEAIHL